MTNFFRGPQSAYAQGSEFCIMLLCYTGAEGKKTKGKSDQLSLACPPSCTEVAGCAGPASLPPSLMHSSQTKAIISGRVWVWLRACEKGRRIGERDRESESVRLKERKIRLCRQDVELTPLPTRSLPPHHPYFRNPGVIHKKAYTHTGLFVVT